MRTTKKSNAGLYDKLRKRIESTVQNFVNLYGGDYDEYVSMANESFMDIVIRFSADDKTKGGIERKVMNRVEWDMKNALKVRVRRDRLLPRVEMPDYITAPTFPSFDLSDFMGCLSDRGRFVVALVFHTPAELSKIVKTSLGKDEKRIRYGLMSYLRNSCRWSVREVESVFSEVRDKLGGYT